MVGTDMGEIIDAFINDGSGADLPDAAIETFNTSQNSDTIQVILNDAYFDALAVLPIDDMPLLINSDDEFAAFYAHWRLDHGK